MYNGTIESDLMSKTGRTFLDNMGGLLEGYKIICSNFKYTNDSKFTLTLKLESGDTMEMVIDQLKVNNSERIFKKEKLT